VQWEFLDRALENFMCVGLECEYTDAVKNVKKKNLPPEKKQCAAVLQLAVALETLVFQICHTDAVPELLRKFLNNDAIMFWGAAIQHDVQMLKHYGITIPGHATSRERSPTQPLTILQVSMLYLTWGSDRNL
jgi:hypothetical protein